MHEQQRLRITIEAQFSPELYKLQNDAPEGVLVQIPPVSMRRDANLETWILITLAILPAIASTIQIVDWLTQKFNTRHVRRIVVRHRELLRFTRDDLTHAIEHELTINEENP
jgi:hypothetical protein